MFSAVACTRYALSGLRRSADAGAAADSVNDAARAAAQKPLFISSLQDDCRGTPSEPAAPQTLWATLTLARAAVKREMGAPPHRARDPHGARADHEHARAGRAREAAARAADRQAAPAHADRGAAVLPPLVSE